MTTTTNPQQGEKSTLLSFTFNNFIVCLNLFEILCSFVFPNRRLCDSVRDASALQFIVDFFFKKKK